MLWFPGNLIDGSADRMNPLVLKPTMSTKCWHLIAEGGESGAPKRLPAPFSSSDRKGRSLYPKGRRTQTMASPQAIAAFRVQALERSRFAVGRLPAAYGDWSARRLGCRCEVNGVKWPWNSLAELTTRPVSAPRPAIAVALDDRAAVGTRDFPSSPPMGDSFWLGL